MLRGKRRWSVIFAMGAGLLSLAGQSSDVRADYVGGLNPRGENYLSLRTGPGSRYEELLRMEPDTLLTVLARKGNWLRVQLEDGTIGWAYSRYIFPGEPSGATRTGTSATEAEGFATSEEADAVAAPTESAAPVEEPPTQLSEGEWVKYVNSRFGASIVYPSGIFNPQPPPDNNDGRRFTAIDGKSSFFIFGQYNALEMTLAELEADDIAGGDYDAVTYKRHGEDWYVLSGYRGDQVFYRKLLLRDDGETEHVFEIIYPKQAKRTFDLITAQMAKSFFAPDTNGADMAASPADTSVTPQVGLPPGSGNEKSSGEDEAETATAEETSPAEAETPAVSDSNLAATQGAGLADLFRSEFLELRDNLR